MQLISSIIIINSLSENTLFLFQQLPDPIRCIVRGSLRITRAIHKAIHRGLQIHPGGQRIRLSLILLFPNLFQFGKKLSLPMVAVSIAVVAHSILQIQLLLRQFVNRRERRPHPGIQFQHLAEIIILRMFHGHGPHDDGRSKPRRRHGHGAEEEEGVSLPSSRDSVGGVGGGSGSVPFGNGGGWRVFVRVVAIVAGGGADDEVVGGVGGSEELGAEKGLFVPGETGLGLDFEGVHEFVLFGGRLLGGGEFGGGYGGFAGNGASGRIDVVVFVISLGRLFVLVFGFVSILRIGFSRFRVYHGVVAICVFIFLVIVFVHRSSLILRVPKVLFAFIVLVRVPSLSFVVQTHTRRPYPNPIRQIALLIPLRQRRLKNLIELIVPNLGREGPAIRALEALGARRLKFLEDLPPGPPLVHRQHRSVPGPPSFRRPRGQRPLEQPVHFPGPLLDGRPLLRAGERVGRPPSPRRPRRSGQGFVQLHRLGHPAHVDQVEFGGEDAAVPLGEAEFVAGQAFDLEKKEEFLEEEGVVDRDAEFDVAEVPGAEGLDVAAGGAGGGSAGGAAGVDGSEEGVVEPAGEGVVEGVEGDGGGDFADGALADFVVGVDSELDGGHGVANYGLVQVGHFVIW